MCGFFGVVNFENFINPQEIINVKKGTDFIKYRGPDDQNVVTENNYCFGFNRLKIIDLYAKNQPYYNHSKSVIMMCNGEIYNYKDLKKILIIKGYKFTSKTDVEVILHGYLEWGELLWEKLNGIFSIAIFDRRINKLFLIRDHLGVKPLHYLINNGKIYFGSDYNSFSFIKDYNLKLNLSALQSYLSFRNVIGKQTFYEEVFDVLPGTGICYDGKKISENQYWDIPTYIESDKGIEFYTDKLDKILEDSVQKQIVSDVPVGAFISGGLDSSLLLSYIKKYKPNINTYISGFDVNGYDEFKYAEIVTTYLGLTKPNRIQINQKDYMDSIEDTIRCKGEPLSVPHENAFLKMSRLMKKNISVVISGEGADEMFAGYGRIFRSPHDYYKSKKFEFKRPIDHFLNRYAWFTRGEKKKFLNPDINLNKYNEYSIEYIESLFKKVSNLNYYNSIYYLLGKLHLPNLLNRLDRMTMAASVEARVPFLDVNLVEFASRLPTKYKLRWKNYFYKIISNFYNSETISEKFDIPKYLLKKIAEKKLPRSIIYRKKMGFPVPLNKWSNNKFNDFAYDILTSSTARSKNIFNITEVKKFLKKKNYNSKEDLDGKKIWMMVNFELWLQQQNF